MNPDMLKNPLPLIESILKKEELTINLRHLQVQEQFLQLINENEINVPTLKLNSDPVEYNHQIVRFNCMVQDNALPTEYYPLSIGENCLAYREVNSEIDFNLNYGIIDTREVFFGINLSNSNNNEGNEENKEEKSQWCSDKLKSGGKMGAFIKVYNGIDIPSLNEVVEVIGILDVNEIDFILNIHALKVNIIKEDKLLFNSNIQLDDNNINNISEIFFNFLKEYIGELGSKMILASLINRNLNSNLLRGINFILSNNNNNDFKQLIKLFKLLIPVVNIINLTIDNLNSKNWLPFSESDEHNLQYNYLQLPKRSLLIINEMNLEEGQLNEIGLNNLMALKELIHNNQIRYKFPFMETIITADIQVIIISNTKSLLNCDLIIPIEIKNNELIIESIKLIQNYISYLTYLVSHQSYTINKELLNYIELRYINLRKDKVTSLFNNKQLINDMDLNFMLDLIKIKVLLNLKNELNDENIWNQIESDWYLLKGDERIAR